MTRNYAPIGLAAKQGPGGSTSNNEVSSSKKDSKSKPDKTVSSDDYDDYLLYGAGVDDELGELSDIAADLDVSALMKKYSQMSNESLAEQLRMLEMEDKMIRMQAATAAAAASAATAAATKANAQQQVHDWHIQ